MNNDGQNTKKLIKFLDELKSGQTLTDYDLYWFRRIKENLSGRLTAGRPRKHANDKERWRFHNARRRALKKKLDENVSGAIDIADKVL